jgi:hypothetical protein
MDIHIIYHLLLYILIFTIITLFSGNRCIIIILALCTLPLAGELLQLYLIRYGFWFNFEWKDVVINSSGALFGLSIGLGIHGK